MIIRVHGTPAPQGSKRHVGHGVMIESSKAVKPWREAVKHAALGARAGQHAISHGGWGYSPTITLPVNVLATFTFRRPKSHYRTGRNAHLLRDDAPMFVAVKPDLDKLLRSTFDALTDAAVWNDDNLAVQVTARKVYGDEPGAEITIEGAYIRLADLASTKVAWPDETGAA